MIRVLVFLALIWIALNIFVWLAIDSLMFHPHRAAYGLEDPGILLVEDSGGPVGMMWRPVAGATKTVLFSHGNGQDLGNLTQIAEIINASGYSFLSYDYPGYGVTPGHPTEKGVYRTAEAAYRYLTADRKIAPENIVLMGYSIGSGPACYLAEKFPVAGLIFQCGFTSVGRCYNKYRLTFCDPFPNVRRLKRIRCPKLFLHGHLDQVVPFNRGREAFAAAAEPKRCVWVKDADHYNLWLAMRPGEYQKELREFIGTSSENLKKEPAATP